MRYGSMVKSLLRYLAKRHLSSHSCPQPARTALDLWWLLSLGAGHGPHKKDEDKDTDECLLAHS